MKKNIFLLALLIAIVSGAYIGVNDYMKVNATKAYVDLLLCEAIDQLATIDYRSNPTQGDYNSARSVKVFKDAENYIPLRLKNDYYDCLKLLKYKNGDEFFYKRESLINSLGNLLEKFNVPIDYIQKESSLVQSKFN
ncbi:hypothetical protein ACFO6R_02090 [Eubacterium multiforme]|uniref:Uncharacterized protein n=1 Tax=Eubacterium multiforme TaxID=83339 RepID=A0ABT9UQM9_9FIRM|nr:hypothetical protein [Eubacterium multiforme]MDQ0148456.1 hypothetical protein [Eubacterium multiforme]